MRVETLHTLLDDLPSAIPCVNDLAEYIYVYTLHIGSTVETRLSVNEKLDYPDFNSDHHVI